MGWKRAVRLHFLNHFARQMTKLILGVALIAPLFLAPSASAEPKTTSINFAYCVVDGFVEEESTGVGYELMSAVLDRLRDHGYQVDVSFVPAMRLLNGYKSKQYDMIYPIMKIKNFTLASFQKWGFDHIPLYSRPLYAGGQFVIYTHVGDERLHNLESLKDKSTVVIAGAYIPVDLVPPTPYRVERVETGQQAFKMVYSGRVDAFLVHKGWGKSILAEMELDELHHGKGFEDIRGGFIVQNNDMGEALTASVDQIIEDMIQDGTYAEILSRYPDNNLVIRPD